MKKIYTIQQASDLVNSKYECEQFIYFATENLEWLEREVQNNFTDLYENGTYPYVLLKTIDLDVLCATVDPIRIFKYRDGKYIEIGELSMVSDEQDEIDFFFKKQ